MDPLVQLSGEFSSPSEIDDWQRIYQVEGWPHDQLESIDIGESEAGHLTLMPYTSVWYGNYRGVLMFKEISGDFIASTRVYTTSRSGSGAPDSQYSLAGIMVRSPTDVTSPETWAPGGENYIFLSSGAADTPGTRQFEVKTTVNSNTNLEISDGWPEVEIRSVRIGSAMLLLRREPGGVWAVHRRYDRPDFPDTLQVGMTVYTDWPTCQSLGVNVHNTSLITDGNPDLIASFDYYRFETPVIPEDMQSLNFYDPGQVSDETILTLFGGD